MSALSKARITVAGRPPSTDQTRVSLVEAIRVGVRVAFAHPALRATTIAATVGALAGQMQAVVVVLFLVRDLALTPALVGAVIAAAGIARILGAFTGVRITGRLGHGPTFILGMTLSSLAGIVMATATGPGWVVFGVLVLAQLLRGSGPALYGINQQTIRQVLVPSEFLARTQATWRFLVFGVQPLGALLGGTLATVTGLRTTLIISSLVMLAGTALALISPLRTLRRLPDPTE